MLLSKTLRKLIITIDGPAGAGKTTMARLLAKKLGYRYLDTGAMYRAITLKAMESDISFKDKKALVKLAEGAKIELKFTPVFKILLDKSDVTAKIRFPEVTAKVHYLAGILGVREVMWKLQRRIGKAGGVVAEGRDTGTVVFPKADIKFYLDAHSLERAKRRQKDLKVIKKVIALKRLESEINVRDKSDTLRKIAPLRQAREAVYIDTTHHSIAFVLAKMLKYISSETI